MRMILFLFLALPFVAGAQINRSAKELACESTREYLVTKLFRGDAYKPGSYGELKAWNNPRSGIAWTLEHQFEVTETNSSGYQKASEVHKTYKFLFYLDKRMKVLKAESYYHN
jgi:hypothetical protein